MKNILWALPLILCSCKSPTTLPGAGAVQFLRTASSSLDPYTNNPNAQQQDWFRRHFWRTLVYSPHFDQKLSWYSNGLVYSHIYAIYPNSTVATQHPEWILKDAAGNNLYIPWGCSSGTCPQYAGDTSNPAFRQWWIGRRRTPWQKDTRGFGSMT